MSGKSRSQLSNLFQHPPYPQSRAGTQRIVVVSLHAVPRQPAHPIHPASPAQWLVVRPLVNPSGGGADQSFQDILTQTTAGNNIKQNILAIKT